MSRLKDKVAVVTGASKGIGAGIAKGLAAEGASVVVNYSSSKEGADKVVAEIKAKGARLLPPDNAQVRLAMRRRRTWQQVLLGYTSSLGFAMAYNPRNTHTVRWA